MNKYGKFFVALSGLMATCAAALQDGVITGEEAVTVAIAFVTAIGVYLKKNA